MPFARERERAREGLFDDDEEESTTTRSSNDDSSPSFVEDTRPLSASRPAPPRGHTRDTRRATRASAQNLVPAGRQETSGKETSGKETSGAGGARRGRRRGGACLPLDSQYRRARARFEYLGLEIPVLDSSNSQRDSSKASTRGSPAHAHIAHTREPRYTRLRTHFSNTTKSRASSSDAGAGARDSGSHAGSCTGRSLEKKEKSAEIFVVVERASAADACALAHTSV